MKNFIFFFSFLITTLGFSQELVVNGDFEAGVSPWVGNAANVVTEGGNSYNAANVATSGDPWAVNLSQVLSLTAGNTYIFSFTAWSDTNRTMIAGIGLNEAPYSATTETVNLTTTAQTFTFTMAAPATSANSRVIFDMGAATGFVGIDNVSLLEVAPTCSDGIQNGDETGVDCGGASCPTCPVTGPTTAAPTPPARPAADVVSIFSEAYTNVAVNQWGPDWGPSSARINDVTIDSNPSKVMDVNAGQTFAGIDFASAAFDATTFTHFHIDYWIAEPLPTGQVLSIKLSNHVGGMGETSAIEKVVTPQGNQWVSLDIPLDEFVAASAPANLDRTAIAQIVITAARADGNVPVDIYMDNIYFHKNTTMSVNDFNEKNISIYPNPVSVGNVMNVMHNTEIKLIELLDLNGRMIKSVNANSMATNGLAKGVYIVKVTDINNKVSNKKLIIN